MSTTSKLFTQLQDDNTIYRLVLLGLLIASPSLHYLCFYHSFDPLLLRLVVSGFCLAALGLSFLPTGLYAAASRYGAIVSYISVNNFLLLGKNGFAPVYLFSAVTIFIALTLLCKKRWEFIAISVLNILATVLAYLFLSTSAVSVPVLVGLQILFTFIAYVSFSVLVSYRLKLQKAVNQAFVLNEALRANDEKLRDKRKNLDSLINSLNDIIFEFDENKICLNVWCRKMEGRRIDPQIFVGKRMAEVVGAEKAVKYDAAMESVISTKRPAAIEFNSDFGSGRWFLVRFAPVYDQAGNYTNRISGSLTDVSEQKRYAEALKENEELLLSAQAIAKTGNWWYDHKSTENYWSKSLYAILEIDTIPEGISKFDYYISLIHPDDRDKAWQYFSTQSDAGGDQFDFKLITPKGNLKYLRALRGKLITDAAGNPQKSFGVLQDISESKLSEKTIRRSQEELMEAQAIAKIGNWKWDVVMNKLSWSAEINNIFEVDPTETNENNFVKLLAKYAHPADRHILKQHLKDLSKITNTSYEYRIITPNGNIKHLSIIVGKLIKREDGALRKVIGTLQDITDRKLAELESQSAENKYKLVLESVKMPAVSLDHDGNIVFCNKYMCDLLGYELHEILGLNWADTFVPEQNREHSRLLFKKDSFQPQNINSVICRNGEQRLISWQNAVGYDVDGEIKGLTGIGEDITELQKKTQELISAKEEAERSSQFKSEFLSIMSHEIRTPMNAVIGTTNLLLSEDPKPEQLEYLNTLKFSGENLLAIINDILDYNKIEAGKLVLSKTLFNIHHLSQKIKKSFYSKASEKNLDIELLIDEQIPAMLIGDQVRLGQVLNNLVSNAIKFTHAGKVIIRLACHKINNHQVSIKFTVADTGIGIAPGNLQLIFDPFEQETQNADANYGGTGLGLAITKRLVELHKSKISVESKVGVGTAFTFTISFIVAAQQLPVAHALPPVPAPNTSADLAGMRILVVDDNKMNLMIASKFLKKWQAEPDEALSGQAAIEMMAKTNYDLIIMDLQMPGMDGFEATRIIRLTNTHIPIIALTADAMPETHSKAFAAGMCDYLTKPFVPQVLFAKVSKYYVPVEG
jgi:PAS domain S-box-containing protein